MLFEWVVKKYLHLTGAIVHHPLLRSNLWHGVHERRIKFLLFDMSCSKNSQRNKPNDHKLTKLSFNLMK